MPYRVGHGNAGLTGGEIKVILIAEPAVGALPTVPIPAGKIWRIMAMSFLFDTSAVTGGRRVAVAVNDSQGREILRRDTRRVQNEGAEFAYSFAPNTGGVWGDDTAGRTVVPIPEQLLLPDEVSLDFLVTAAHDPAGDRFRNIRLLVEEWEGV